MAASESGRAGRAADSPSRPDEAVADLIAENLARRGGPVRQRLAETLHQLGAIDRAVYVAVASVPAPALDDAMRRLSGAGVPDARQVTMPSSTSFPSGHSAAAFAFATAISRDNPWVAIAIQFLAGGVAYSRVHTGVHYPGDTVAGALIGAGAGQAVSSVFDHAIARRSPASRS